MKILVVLCRNPFGSDGGADYAIKGSLRLIAENHQVIVCGFGRDFRKREVGGFPCGGCLGVATNRPTHFVTAMLFGKSYTTWKYGHYGARKRLFQILATDSFDVLWFEQTQAAFAADWKGIARDFPNLRTVVRSHNIESNVVGSGTRIPRLAKALMRREACKLRISEQTVWSCCESIAAISKEDATLVNAALGRPEVKANFLPVIPPTSRTSTTVNPHKGRNRIVFIGDCRWQPNRDAAVWIVNKLASAVNRTLPEIEIQLVGRETERLAKHHPLPSNVKAMGYVERVEPIYESALCALAPICAGSGVNIKVIEAFAQGLPVIGSPLAKRGIECEAFLVANTADEYCSLIRELLECPSSWERLSESAAKFEEKSMETASGVIQAILTREISTHRS